MRKVVTALSSEDLEVNSPEHPSLDALVQSLVEPRYLHHKDKEVRLHTVLACMEAFYLYAPSAPWDVDEILRIFAQIHAQLANLAHCTNASMPNYRNYFRLLSQLATVKVSIVLVELYNQGSGAALETLTELVHTLLDSMHREHPREVMNCASAAIAACIEEYEPSVSAQIPIPILDELLDVLSQGSTSTELVAVHTNASSNGRRKRSQAQAQVPQTVEAIRPAYALCKKILQRCEDRMSTPIVRLVNALLNHNAETLSKSKSILQQTRLHGDQAYRIIYELYRVTPNVLTEIIGNVASLLSSEDDEQRHRVIKLLGRLFYAPRNKYSANGNPTGSVNGNPTMAVQYESCFRDWCAHASDRSVEVRTSVLHCMLRLLKGNVLGSREQQHGNLKQVVEAAVMQSLKDKNCDVRMAAIRGLAEMAMATPQYTSTALLHTMSKRVESRHKPERIATVTALGKLYSQHYMQPKYRILLQSEDDDEEKDAAMLEEASRIFRHGDVTQDQYSWIPDTIVSCLFYTDADDWEMRSRVIQILDDVLLPSPTNTSNTTTSSTTEDEIRHNKVRCTLTALLLSNLSQQNTELLITLFQHRSATQQHFRSYMNLRHRQDANATALDHLLRTPHIPSSLDGAFRAIHSAKDKHVLRVLGAIADPCHSRESLRRAHAEVWKRVRVGKQKQKDGQLQLHVKQLIRRMGMGSTFCLDLIKDAAALAVECTTKTNKSKGKGKSKKVVYTHAALLKSYVNLIAIMSRGMPGCCHCDAFVHLTTLLHRMPSSDMIMRALAAYAPTMASSSSNDDKDEDDDDMRLKLTSSDRKELQRMCLRGNDVALARYAVKVLLSFSLEDDNHHQKFIKGLTHQRVLSTNNPHAASAMAALCVVAESSKDGLESSNKDDVALAFARRGLSSYISPSIVASHDDDEVEIEKSDDEAELKKNNAKTGNKMKRGNSNLQEDYPLIWECMSYCVAHIHGSSKEYLLQHKDRVSKIASALYAIASNNTDSQNNQVMNQKTRVHAVVCLLRLNSSALPVLPMKHPHFHRQLYLMFSRYLCDSNDVQNELIRMLAPSKTDKYYTLAPKLRFLALAIVSVPYPTAVVSRCIVALRKTCDILQGASSSPGMFDAKYKHIFLPEYCIPYAAFVLTHWAMSCDDKVSDKALDKKWKTLLDPLVHSIDGGTAGDNIGYLMHMATLLETRYVPIMSKMEDVEDEETFYDHYVRICQRCRDVLSGMVKEDKHLDHRGSDQHHGELYGDMKMPMEYFKLKEVVNVKPKAKSIRSSRVSFGKDTIVQPPMEEDSMMEFDVEGGNDVREEEKSPIVTTKENKNKSPLQTHLASEKGNIRPPVTNHAIDAKFMSTPSVSLSQSHQSSSLSITPKSSRLSSSSLVKTPPSEISDLTAPPSSSRPLPKQRRARGRSRNEPITVKLTNSSQSSSAGGRSSGGSSLVSVGKRKSSRRRTSAGFGTVPKDEFDFDEGIYAEGEDSDNFDLKEGRRVKKAATRRRKSNRKELLKDIDTNVEKKRSGRGKLRSE